MRARSSPAGLPDPARCSGRGDQRHFAGSAPVRPAIARRLGRLVSTVSVVLRRRGLSFSRALEPRPPLIRYERDRPGELIHMDTKKLGRIQRVGHRITGDRTARLTVTASAPHRTKAGR